MQPDARELQRGQVGVAVDPGSAAVGGFPHPAVVAHPDGIVVLGIESDGVHIWVQGMGRAVVGRHVLPGGTAIVGPDHHLLDAGDRLPFVAGLPAQVDHIGAGRVHGDDVIVPALAAAVVGRLLQPGPGSATIGGLEQHRAVVLSLDRVVVAGVEHGRIGCADGQLDAPEVGRGQSARELRPGSSAIGALVDAGTPEGSVQFGRAAYVHHQIGGPIAVRAGEQRCPTGPTVRGLEDAPRWLARPCHPR